MKLKISFLTGFLIFITIIGIIASFNGNYTESADDIILVIFIILTILSWKVDSLKNIKTK